MALVRLAGISPESIVDGSGLRYTIFLQGCSHNCKGCQNPDTHSFDGGYTIDTEEILNEVLSNPMLDGITLSGGDPFFQAKNLIELCKDIKNNNLDIWAYTGFKFEDFINKSNGITNDMVELLKNIDILVDGPFILEQKTLNIKFRGSRNQRIIDVQKSLNIEKVIEKEV